MSQVSTGPRKPRRPVHLPGQRAAIACIPCRQRKVRCTSGWPSCKACINRSIKCRYAGVSQGHPAVDIALQAQTINPSETEVRDFSQIPATELAQAADFFRDNFGSTLLFFIDPLTFSTQFCSGELQPSFTFAILALTARFSPWSSIEESRTYCTRARECLERDSDKVSLHMVQAYLIHCVYGVGCGFESSAWIHLGNAIRMAQILRLSVMDKPTSNFDWGRPAQNGNEDAITIELKRRTFWSCFFLDKLLSNGRDRPSVIDEKDICCHFPVTEEDLIFRRFHQASTLSTVDLSHGTSSNLYVSLARILSILGDIITWHGRGGRYTDSKAPWRSDVPFTVLDNKLREWQRQVPDHLRYSKDTFAALSILNSNQLKVWGLGYLFYFLAKIYLLSEYIPFLPPIGYNPFDGPEKVEAVSEDWGNAPPDWWEGCIEGLSRSSDSITELFRLLTVKLVVFPGVYPFIGLCLMKTATTHLFFALIDEKGFRDTTIARKAEALLQDDIKAMESLSQFWDLPKYWINQIGLYRALIIKSRTVDEPLSLDGFKAIADGIMNYIRETRDVTTDIEVDEGNVFSSKETPSSPSTVSTRRNSKKANHINPHRGRREQTPISAQPPSEIEWDGLPNDQDGQDFQFNDFLRDFDNPLENQILSLANWEYFNFS